MTRKPGLAAPHGVLVGRRAALLAPLLLVAARARADVPVFVQPGGSRNEDVGQSDDAAALLSADVVSATGERRRIDSFAEPLVLVNLWASWCAGCLEEMASMARMRDAFAGSARVVLLGHPSNAAVDARFLARHPLPLLSWSLAAGTPPETVAAIFRQEDASYEVPRSFVLAGAPRRVVLRVTGPRDWSSQSGLEELAGAARLPVPQAG